MKLRPYQRASLKALDKAFHRVRSVLYVLPTGAGKTEVAVADMMKEVHAGGRVLVLAHRRELIDQVHARFLNAGLPRKHVGVMMGDDGRTNPDAPVQIASIQTAIRRNPPPATLVVVDEARRSAAVTYRKILANYPRADILGLTATPYRLDGAGLRDVFDEIVEGPKPSELIALGFLDKPLTLTVPDSLLPDLSGVKKQGGDYAKGQLEKAASTKAIVGNLVSHWLKYAKNRPTVLYAASVAHAKICRDEFASSGVKVEHVDADTPKEERAAIIERLRNGKTKVLTNVDILTEGWDFPELGCVILARPTMSKSLHYQMIGRIMRPKSKRAVILDHAGNVKAHGFPEEDHEHSLEAEATKAGTQRPPTAKHCPSCDAAVQLASPTCAECGHVFWECDKIPDEIAGLLEIGKPVERQKTCAGFGETVGKCDNRPGLQAFSPSTLSRRVASTGESVWRCWLCARRMTAQNPKWRKNVCDIPRKRNQDPEYRARASARANKLHQDPEYRARHASGVQISNKLRYKPSHTTHKDN